MKSIVAISLLLAAGCTEMTDPNDPNEPGDDDGKSDVWGVDSRKERYQYASNAKLQVAIRASAATFMTDEIEFDAVSNTWKSKILKTLHDSEGLCDGERFETQPAVSYCSATLIAPDIMLTAGHCHATTPCEELITIFDYAYEAKPTDAMTIAQGFTPDKVYRCKEKIAAGYEVDYDNESGHDYALYRLDRPVTDRPFAQVNWDQPLAEKQVTFVVGHPSRLPQKIARGAVISDAKPDFVEHSTDVFGGNSGGGMFDKDGRLIGIHVHSSAKRYVPDDADRTCNVVAVCGDNAECKRKPHSYKPSALKKLLAPELRAELGVPADPVPAPQ